MLSDSSKRLQVTVAHFMSTFGMRMPITQIGGMPSRFPIDASDLGLIPFVVRDITFSLVNRLGP